MRVRRPHMDFGCGGRKSVVMLRRQSARAAQDATSASERDVRLFIAPRPLCRSARIGKGVSDSESFWALFRLRRPRNAGHANARSRNDEFGEFRAPRVRRQMAE